MSLRWLAVLLSVAGLSIPAAAQAPSTAQVPVLRTNAYTVVVDVVVNDKGTAVHGIDRNRFHVYEDGREQNIAFFDEHRPAASQVSVQRRALPPHYFNNLPVHPSDSAVNVLLLDALNTPVADQVYLHKQMLEYVRTVEPGTTMAVFTLASRLRMIQGFTSKIDDLVAALEKAKSAPRQSVVLDSDAGNAFDSAIGNLEIMHVPAADLQSIQQFQSDYTAHQTDNRVQITLDALQQLARYLSAVPGRKNLIWFSGSFPIMLGPDDGSDPLRNVRSYNEQTESGSKLLSAARVAVYPVDARGVMALPGADATNNGLSTPNGGSGFANMISRSMTGDANSHFTMEKIAHDTGGTAFFNTNGFKAAVAQAVENGASYYTVGYVPDSKKFNGEFRKIKVKLDDSKYELEYRSGYYADPLGKPNSRGIADQSLMATATLHGAPLSTQVLFQTRVLPATDPEFKDANIPIGPAGELSASLKAPTQRYVVDLAVDPRTLSFDSTADGKHTDAIEFAIIAYDADGRRVNYMDRRIQLSLAQDQYAQIMKSGVPVRMALDFPSGEGSLRIAVHDISGVRVGSLEIPIEVKSN